MLLEALTVAIATTALSHFRGAVAQSSLDRYKIDNIEIIADESSAQIPGRANSRVQGKPPIGRRVLLANHKADSDHSG